VYKKLLNISYRPPIAQAREPRKLAIHGNIFVQFVFLSWGLLLAFIIVIAEFNNTFICCFCFVRDSVSFLIRNCLQQSQKAFLIGLKYILNMKGQLLNQQPVVSLSNSCRTKTKNPIGGKAKLYVPQ